LSLQNENSKVLKEETFRIGEEWEWYPEAKKLSDNNMNPGEERTYKLDAILDKVGSYNIKAVVTKHRISQKMAEVNNLGDNYPRFITIFDQDYRFKVK
ncbi:MAG: hypothetical protein ACJARG_001218, partial [Arcticibacterium sp.]